MASCFSARRALALALMAIIFLPCLSLSVSAHVSSNTSTTENEVFLLYRSSDGDIACRKANALERQQLETGRPQDLHQINHINDFKQDSPGAEALPSHLTIILRATANLNANDPAKAAFVRAASAWENLIISPVTIYIDVDFGPTNFGQAWPTNVLGSTSSPPTALAIYNVLRNSLLGGSNSATKTAVYNALPVSAVPTDLGSVSSVSLSKSLARAIGFSDPTAQPTDDAAKIAFNSQSVSYDFDGTEPIIGTDFEAVATHEIE